MVVVAEKADVDIEVVDKVGEHVLTDPDGGRRVGRHQLGGDGGDDQIQAAGHVRIRHLLSA